MIKRFGRESALLLVDVQKGVDDLKYWGGPRGRRNNLEAETRLLAVLKAWRNDNHTVIFTTHDSREARSPLKLSAPGGQLKNGFEPKAGEVIVRKDVNSAFIGTPLELELRRRQITRLVIGGFFTNMCISTTVRMANNLGFDTYLIHDACMCTNRTDINGVEWEADVVHHVTVASLHEEFCTAITHVNALALLKEDSIVLERKQGNE